MKLLRKGDKLYRGTEVICHEKGNSEPLFTGTIVRISKDKTKFYVLRNDGRYSSRSAPKINGSRTWECRLQEDGKWSGRPDSYRAEDFTIYVDVVDNWKKELELA